MTEWKEYTGSDEQIAEIRKADDVLFKFVDGYERLKSSMFIGDWKNHVIKSYWICNPHPLADMICQQARTGQQVWVRLAKCLHVSLSDRYEFVEPYQNYSIYVTNKPDWNIPGAEYSFEPFEEESCK